MISELDESWYFPRNPDGEIDYYQGAVKVFFPSENFGMVVMIKKRKGRISFVLPVPDFVLSIPR